MPGGNEGKDYPRTGFTESPLRLNSCSGHKQVYIPRGVLTIKPMAKILFKEATTRVGDNPDLRAYVEVLAETLQHLSVGNYSAL